jgi:uncharacterized spore protein YtfJ
MDDTMTATIEPIEDMLKRLNVNAVFGAPIKEGDATILPVANVGYGFGYGSGRGRGPATTSGDEAAAPGTASEGEGSGGGGGGMAQPKGVIRITADGVKFEPIMDMTRISLAGIAMVAWSVFWIAKTVRAFTQTSSCKCCG